VLRNATFRKLYTALALSSFGDWLGFLATTALATQLADSFQGKAYATGGVLVFRLLPAVLFGPLAGAFADRWDRRTTMVVCDLLRFLLFLSIPLVGSVADRDTSLVYLLLASFLIETVSLFWIPAKEASVPNLVPREQLEGANQLTLIATYGSAPVAAAVFALLSLVSRALGTGFDYFRTGPVDLALYVNAATFLFAAVTVYRLHDLPSPGRAERAALLAAGQKQQSVFGSLRDGLRFMGRTPLARGLLVGMLGALAAGGAIIALGRLFAETVLSGGDAAYGLLFGAIFTGIAAGVALGPRALGDLSRRRVFGPSIVGAGAALVFMSVVPNLFLATVATLLVGAFAGVAYVVGITLLGLEVEDELRGRTFGLVQSLMRVDLLLVTATTPFIAGAIGRREGPFGLGHQRRVGHPVGRRAAGDGRRDRQLPADGRPARRAAARRTSPGACAAARRPPHPGTFVALEGGEGAGKSTQLRLLQEWLAARGHDVVLTREPAPPLPGADPLGAARPGHRRARPRAEAMLYAADRAQHVAQVVRPALARGAVVLTDRYADSSLAYQGAGRELAVDEVARLSHWATDGLLPDLVVVLDVDPVVGLARAGDSPDRIEAESLDFHRRVRDGFLQLAEKDPERYLVVPADQAPELVLAAVQARLLTVVPATAARVGEPVAT
jgi:dTMP kinase